MTTTWEPGLGDHLRTIWRRKWFILAGAAAVAEVVFLVLSFAVEPSYQSDSSIRLTIEADGGLLLDGDRVEYASRVYAELAESPAVLDDAIERSGLELDRDQAAGDIDVEWARPPGFIDVTATADSASGAVALADGMAAALAATIAADAERFDGGPGSAGVTADIVEPAVAPTSPFSPRPARDAVAAFLIALVVLAELVALWRPIRGLLPTSRTAELVTELVGVPSITLTGDPDDRTRLGSFAARHLDTNPAIVLVQCTSSPRPAAAVRLGEALTAVGRRTLVVDGDRHDPSLHWWLSLPRAPGLDDVATERLAVSEAVFESEAKAEVSLLTAGGDGDTEPSPTDDLLDTLSPGYDCVVVDIGVDATLDGIAAEVAGLRNSTVLVIDPERTTRRRLAELVHGFGGHEDVVAILLLTRAAASAETSRLSARAWTRRDGRRVEPVPRTRRLGSIRAGRRAS